MQIQKNQHAAGNRWCPDLESNQGHKDFQSFALPTELSGHKEILFCRSTIKWCPDLESNQGHKDFQSFALPTELSGRRKITTILTKTQQELKPTRYISHPHAKLCPISQKITVHPQLGRSAALTSPPPLRTPHTPTAQPVPAQSQAAPASPAWSQC